MMYEPFMDAWRPTEEKGCNPMGKAHVPLSPRHFWRSMDISVSRSPKLPRPHNSAMPSGRMRDMENLGALGYKFGSLLPFS